MAATLEEPDMALGTAGPTSQSDRVGGGGSRDGGGGAPNLVEVSGAERRAPRMRAAAPPSPGPRASEGEGAERPVGAVATGAVRPDARPAPSASGGAG